jgi:hypothetical protein
MDHEEIPVSENTLQDLGADVPSPGSRAGFRLVSVKPVIRNRPFGPLATISSSLTATFTYSRGIREIR